MTVLPFAGEVMRGRLLKRYKRFFADCVLDDSGQEIIAHTPNTGAMTGLLEKGNPVLLTYRPSPKRKLSYSLEAIQASGIWVGTNTMRPNAFVAQAILEERFPSLVGYGSIVREVKFGENLKSRVDIFLSQHENGEQDAYVEVKNVTLAEGNCAKFPDAVTARGRKHIEALAHQIRSGARGVLVFLVQRDDCRTFSPAFEIDPEYCRALQEADANGLEIIVCQAQIDEHGIRWFGFLDAILQP